MTKQILSKSNKGFTLIELLIVVAIIAILAAIAVPNFLEAQVRSKVSRAKADMRTMVTGLESYRVDSNAYPKCNNFGLAGRRDSDPTTTQYEVLEKLSTPIAYITNAFLPDPFESQFRSGSINPNDGSFNPEARIVGTDEHLWKVLKYYTPGPAGLQDVETPAEKASYYAVVVCTGPDLVYPNMGGLFSSSATPEAVCNWAYDPTNGTVSTGSIFKVTGVTSGDSTEYGGTFFSTIQQVQE